MLRIFFDAPPDPARAFAWALFDARGVCIRRGRDVAGRWPSAAPREAVLAVDLAPLLSLKLPPMSAARLDGAVRLLLEDRLATPLAAQHLRIGAQQSDGRVRVALAERALLDALSRLGCRRAVGEAELIAAEPGVWHWCVHEDGSGFVRRDDGSAFSLDLPSGLAASARETPAALPSGSVPDSALFPTELALALAEGDAPKTLCLHAALPAAVLERWQQALGGCRLTVAAPWQWTQAAPAVYAQAADLLPHEEPADTAARPAGAGWRYAAILLGAALALHVVATGIAWGTAQWQHWRIGRDWQTLAAEVRSANVASVPFDASQWPRAYAQIRHRAGLAAPDDALPLLARAAPFLYALPAGTVRSAAYADRAWTFDCTPLDAARRQSLETNLRNAGLQTMSGSSADGYRLRVHANPYAKGAP